MKDTLIFAGLDRDSEIRFAEKGMYRDALNVFAGTVANSKEGSVVTVKGNTLVQNDFLPAEGANICIGFKEYRAEGVGFFFLFNDTGKHGIYKYARQTNLITRVFPSDFTTADVLNFRRENLITGIVYIDNKLSWCDGVSETSNPPRQINTVDAALYPLPYKTTEFDKHFTIDYIKMPPTFPLRVEIDNDDSNTTYLDKKSFQFSYSYVYKDGQRSTWSPLSKLVSAGYTQTQGENFIKITLDPNRLFKVEENKTKYQQHIDQVVFAFRDYPTSPYKVFDRRKLSDLTAPLEFFFRNDQSYPVVDVAESGLQAHGVPLLSKGHEISLNRAFFGNNIEDFDNYKLQVSSVSESWIDLDVAPYTYDHNKFGNYLSFKDNSVYQLGVLFYDRANRGSNVYTLDSLKVRVPADWRNLGETIAASRNGLKYWAKKFTLDLLPPEWATHYQIVRTENQTYSYFAQGITNDCIYISSYDKDGNPQIIRKKIGIAGVWNPDNNLFGGLFIIQGSGVDERAKFVTFDNPLGSGNFLTTGKWSGSENAFGNEIFEDGKGGDGRNFIVRRDDYYSLGNAATNPNNNPDRSGNFHYDEPVGATQSGAKIFAGGVDANGYPITDISTDGLSNAIDVALDITNWFNTTPYFGKAPVIDSTGSIKLIAESAITPATNYVITSITIFNEEVLGTPVVPFTFNTTAIQNTATRTYSNYKDFLDAITALLNTFKTEYSATRDNLVTYVSTSETSLLISNKKGIKDPASYNGRSIAATSTNGLVSSTTNMAGGSGNNNLRNPSNNINYIYEKGDRVRLAFKASGEKFGKVLDFEIKDFKEERYLVIPYDPVFVTQEFILGKGVYIEVYRKRKNDTKPFYYEMGECYPVTNPHLPNRAFSKKNFEIWEGDTHKLRGVTHYANTIRMTGFDIYSMNPDAMNRAEVWEKGNGRPNFVPNNEAKRIHKKTSIKWSGGYVTGTSVNNLCAFDPLDEKILSPEFGAIVKLQVSDNSQAQGNVMLSVHEAQVVSNYIGQNVLKNAGGGGQIATTEDVIGTSDPLMNGIGCQNPESIVQNDGRVYGIDTLRGYVWRYSNDGFTILSDAKNRNYFSKKLAGLQKSDLNYLLTGGFDPFFNVYHFTNHIYGGVDGTSSGVGSGEALDQYTETYNEASNLWMSKMSFIPECYGKVNNDFISFKNGNLYLHHSNPLNANFYGVQYKCSIEGILNTPPNSVKILQNVQISSQNFWECPTIKSSNGQETELLGVRLLGVPVVLPQDFILQEGVYKAAVMRDKNTPNMPLGISALARGDVMRDQAFLIKFECTTTQDSALYWVDTNFILSQMTNK